ncbi:MAG: LemA family protein [Bacteroidetes bacterium]|nr:LemA family protein [Bacteroidota bacterium]
MKIAGREISTGLIIGVVLGIIVLWGFIWNNGTVDANENVKGQWGNVENAYQRRSDLIPNLVNTVQGYAKHEKEVLTAVTEARSRVGQMNIDPSKLTPDALEKFDQNQGALSSSLGRLMVVMEQYPDLKANENFIALQAELAGTENRINTERTRFNDLAVEYNKRIQKIPGKLFNAISGFEEQAYFKSKPGADVAPTVKF